jgi:hypothetical protein
MFSQQRGILDLKGLLALLAGLVLRAGRDQQEELDLLVELDRVGLPVLRVLMEMMVQQVQRGQQEELDRRVQRGQQEQMVRLGPQATLHQLAVQMVISTSILLMIKSIKKQVVLGQK